EVLRIRRWALAAQDVVARGPRVLNVAELPDPKEYPCRPTEIALGRFEQPSLPVSRFLSSPVEPRMIPRAWAERPAERLAEQVAPSRPVARLAAAAPRAAEKTPEVRPAAARGSVARSPVARMALEEAPRLLARTRSPSNPATRTSRSWSEA